MTRLRYGIDDEGDDHDRREPARDRRQLREADGEDGERDGGERDHLPAAEPARRQLAAGRARVAGVDRGIDEAVDGHRERACPEHHDRDPHEHREARPAVDRKDRSDVRVGQREHRVLEAHEVHEALTQRDGAHAWRCVVGSERSSLTACSSTGASTAQPSSQARGLPGSVITTVRLRVPETPRESAPWGVCRNASARSASSMPGSGARASRARPRG